MPIHREYQRHKEIVETIRVLEMKREKLIHVAVLESQNEDALKKALSQIKSLSGINFMIYKVEDSRLRMIFAALKEGVVASQ